MGSGLATVAYDDAAAHEFIRNGENGLLAAVGDEPAYLAAAVRLASEPTLRARLSTAGPLTTRTLTGTPSSTASPPICWKPPMNFTDEQPTPVPVILSAAKDPLRQSQTPAPPWILRCAQDDGQFGPVRIIQTLTFLHSTFPNENPPLASPKLQAKADPRTHYESHAYKSAPSSSPMSTSARRHSKADEVTHFLKHTRCDA
jgi:hypothetical protein